MNHLKDWLATRNMIQEDLAKILDVTRETVNRNANADAPTAGFWRKFYLEFGADEAEIAFPNNKEQAR